MNNYKFSNDKSLFDIFNMINPSCYQAMIMDSIITDNKSAALEYISQLETAFEYYKWEKPDKKCNYIDSLICASKLDKWQKLALMCIISNDTNKCKEIINNEITQLTQNAINVNKQIANKNSVFHRRTYSPIDYLFNSIW